MVQVAALPPEIVAVQVAMVAALVEMPVVNPAMRTVDLATHPEAKRPLSLDLVPVHYSKRG